MTKISDYAFAGYDYLTDITIGAQVTSIGNYIVLNCKNINGFNVSAGNQNYSAEGQCLIDTTTKTVIAGCKDSEIPVGVEHIAPYVFEEVKFTTKEIVIPDSVLTIGDFAFAYTNLDKITFGSGLTNIGFWAFARNYEADEPHDLEVRITDLEAWCNIDFYDGSSLPFQEASKVYVGDTLVSGPGNTLDLANVTKVKSWAFYGAPIYAVHIPNETTFIGEGVFSNRIVLEEIILDEGNTALMTTADKTGLIYKGADGNVLIAVTNSARDLNYKDEEIDVIGNSTFYGKNIGSVVLPDRLTKIGDFAFMYCYLTSVTLNEKLESIGKSAFENSRLESVTIPASVTHIGERAFMDARYFSSASFDSTSNWWFRPYSNDQSDEFANVSGDALGCLKDGREMNNYIPN